MTTVVGTTMHAFAMREPEQSLSWLRHAEAIAESTDDEVRFFAALETDARGRDAFAPLLERMEAIGAPWNVWWFEYDDGAEVITTENRLRRITAGQNMANAYATSCQAEWLLFCAGDCAPPPDVLPKLWELDHPICGPEIPTYGLWQMEGTGVPYRYVGPRDMVPDPEIMIVPTSIAGSTVDTTSRSEFWEPLYPDFPVLAHMASAACILLHSSVFGKLPWRVDVAEGWSDDPSLWHDAMDRLGLETYIRTDCIALHYPDVIGPMEHRYAEADRRVQR